MEKTIHKSWKVELEKAMKELLLELHENQQKEESKYHDVLHAPYIAGFSEQLARHLKQIKIGVTFQEGNTLYNTVYKLKPEKHPDDRKDIIYCLGCKSCNQHYLGETQQFFPSRRYQHQYAIKCNPHTNEFAQHVHKKQKL